MESARKYLEVEEKIQMLLGKEKEARNRDFSWKSVKEGYKLKFKRENGILK